MVVITWDKPESLEREILKDIRKKIRSNEAQQCYVSDELIGKCVPIDREIWMNNFCRSNLLVATPHKEGFIFQPQ